MNKQTLTMLVAAVALCAAAILVYRQQNTPSGVAGGNAGKHVADGAALLKELAAQTEKIAQVEFASKTGRIELIRGGDHVWKAANYHGYPVDTSKITKLFFDLTGIKVAATLTANPKKYSVFGLDGEIGEKGVLRFRDAGGRQLLELFIGGERKNESEEGGPAPGGGRYYRKGGDPNVYLAQEELWSLNQQLTSWADTSIVSIPAESVMSITVDHDSTESFTIDWQNEKPEIDELPADQQLKVSEASQLRNSLNYFRLDDVLAAGTTEALALKFDTKLDAQLKDGTLLRLKGVEQNGNYYIALNAEYTSPVFTSADNATTQTLADAQQQAEAAKGKIEEFQKKHSNWVYLIATAKYRAMGKTRSSVIEDIPEEPAEAETPPSAAGHTDLIGESLNGPMPEHPEAAAPIEAMTPETSGSATMQPELPAQSSDAPTSPGVSSDGTVPAANKNGAI